MKESKLTRLFEAARAETPPHPEPDFESRVLREIRRYPASAAAPSLLDQLAMLLPRVACASVLVIACCLLGAYLLQDSGQPAFGDEAAQFNEQWLNPAGGL
jgi:hypothetical protein